MRRERRERRESRESRESRALHPGVAEIKTFFEQIAKNPSHASGQGLMEMPLWKKSEMHRAEALRWAPAELITDEVIAHVAHEPLLRAALIGNPNISRAQAYAFGAEMLRKIRRNVERTGEEQEGLMADLYAFVAQGYELPGDEVEEVISVVYSSLMNDSAVDMLLLLPSPNIDGSVLYHIGSEFLDGTMVSEGSMDRLMQHPAFTSEIAVDLLKLAKSRSLSDEGQRNMYGYTRLERTLHRGMVEVDELLEEKSIRTLLVERGDEWVLESLATRSSVEEFDVAFRGLLRLAGEAKEGRARELILLRASRVLEDAGDEKIGTLRGADIQPLLESKSAGVRLRGISAMGSIREVEVGGRETHAQVRR